MDGPTHAERRRALAASLGEGIVLVRGQGREGTNPNFLYLTGIDEPRAALLLARDGVRILTGRHHPGPDYVRGRIARELLFLPAPDRLAARWGEEAEATSEKVDPSAAGVDAVLAAGQLGTVLEQNVPRAAALHYVRAAQGSLGVADDPDVTFVARLRRTFFGLRITDATPVVYAMRRIKDDAEVERIERSIALTARALERVRPLVRAAQAEHELEAEIIRTYREAGATHAFDPIVAAGANATRLHYTANRARLAPGQLVLIDTGARLDGYCSDVTRCYPVGGSFSARQREVYEVVLGAAREAIAACRRGGSIADVHARAWRAIDACGFGEHFVHGTSHHLGLETHDAGDVHEPLEPGCVVTVEPGVYLPGEQLGVRIEDDVLVTEGEPRVLSGGIASDPEQIERDLS